MKMIDSHCHLDQLTSEELRRHLALQEQVGVVGYILAGVDPDSWERQQDVCATYKNIRRAAGIHPWAIEGQSDETLNDWFQRLEEQLPHCMALGEVGLDFLKATPKEKQLEVARRQLDLAVRYKKPVVCHVVKAHNEFLDLLEGYPTVTGVIHAFASSPEISRRYLEKGFLLGLGHSLLHPKRDALIRSLPLEGILFESDDPLEVRKKSADDVSVIVKVLQHFAKTRGIDETMLANVASENCHRVLGWPDIQLD